jgi:hypothetical protein
MEINPKVKYPDHTEEAISRPLRKRPIFDLARLVRGAEWESATVEKWATYDPAL